MIRHFLRGSLAAAAAILLLAPGAIAQTVDELVARNLAAKGGVDRLKSIQSIRQVSSMTMQGMDAPMVILTKRPNLLRQEITLGNQKVINGFDGETAWIVNPLVSPGGAPIRITGPEVEIIRQQSDFDPPLMNYKARGYLIELVGTETSGSRKVHHLRLTQPGRAAAKGQVQHMYLDAETGLEAKLVTETEGSRFEQELLDWRSVDGVMVPFHIRLLSNGVLQSETRVEKVEFNVRIDDSVFAMPK
jgi:outer membrane lipoprotein-sorting protein